MRPRTTAASLLALTLTACASGGACPPARACGAASWLEGGGVVEGRMVLAPVAEVAAAGAAGSLAGRESLALSPRAVLVRFDLAPLAGAAGVERAVLALTPDSGWRVAGRAPLLVVRAALAPWSADGVASGALPPLSPAPEATATLPAAARGPVRVDVTAVVRAWQAGTLPAAGLALEADGADAVFRGAGALALAERPRLEVVLR